MLKGKHSGNRVFKNILKNKILMLFISIFFYYRKSRQSKNKKIRMLFWIIDF